MTLGEVYQFFVREGIKVDSRKIAQIRKSLLEVKAEYNKLSKAQRQFFDHERLNNPYADSRILFGEPGKKVRGIMVGIDAGVGEVLLADRLIQQGKSIDVILAHHPEGVALAGLSEVMRLQIDLLEDIGVRHVIAKDLLEKRIVEVARRLHSSNFSRSVDAARLLGIPFMCCHTPADNHVNSYLQKLVDRSKPKTLGKLVDLLLKEPEYQDARRQKAGPEILAGSPDSPAGRIWVDMTGGTEGSKEIFARLSQLGVDTLLCMHLSESHLEKIKPEHIHVVNAGHIASDNLGMNLLLDKLHKQADFEIISCSGFRRFRR